MMESVGRVDEAGRVVIPAEWRRDWGRKVLIVRLDDQQVLIRSLRKRGRLTDLIDSIEIKDVKDFGDAHNLRGVVYG
jgi:bifunctional DNA-binding transcriptional regulator/antitoxin component of YhaV-PrlF toxin-antitoxin module